jgi:hypothetical protein
MLTTEMTDDAVTMIDAVGAGNAADGRAAEARLAAIRAAGLLEAGNDIAITRVARLTGVAHDAGDSLHRLVMDLHKALNRLAANCAEEIIAGAHVFGLRPQDRACIDGFMRGLNETRPLKFDHPGLDTMATRSGERLLIQNDIGTTDAHVMVIAVSGHSVTVTYTDIHMARAKFFIGQFERFAATWSGLDRHAAAGLGEDDGFLLVTGQYDADDDTARDEFLAAIGAALVFLIDWNKARKLLRTWVAKDDAVGILAHGPRVTASVTGAFSNSAATTCSAPRSAMPRRPASGSASDWTRRSAATPRSTSSRRRCAIRPRVCSRDNPSGWCAIGSRRT